MLSEARPKAQGSKDPGAEWLEKIGELEGELVKCLDIVYAHEPKSMRLARHKQVMWQTLNVQQVVFALRHCCCVASLAKTQNLETVLHLQALHSSTKLT